MRRSRAGEGLPLADAEDEERDRHVLAGERDDGEGVEQLVVAEDAWQRVWPLGRIDESACAVGEAAGREEQNRGYSFAVRELR